tara:strand:+ start:670 stop:1221 length:552 start_codon:yes stop_codon:yes gene_type:complete
LNIIKNKGIITVSGPSRGGKSQWAETIFNGRSQVYYLATSKSYHSDIEWKKRIKQHKSRRPENWETIECSENLIESIQNLNGQNNNLLIDSIGGFVTQNLEMNTNSWSIHTNKLIDVLLNFKGCIIIVIEEVGWGLVPSTKLGNTFRDRIGTLSQQLQSIASNSWLVFQGRAINLKEIGIPIQ